MFNGMTAVWEALPYIVEGAGITVGTVLCAMLFGLFCGVPLAVAQVYGGPVARRLVALYVWFFRGVPILVLLFLFYFRVQNYKKIANLQTISN